MDVARLSLGGLTQARLTVLNAVASASVRPDAAALFGEPDSILPAVRANARWADAPATAVRDLYSGVLYDALGLAGLPTGAKRRATARVLVASAVWGMLRLDDAVPAYRCSMTATLPELGATLAAHWRPHLAREFDELSPELVLDCRSSDYQAAWRPRGALAERVVPVRVMREQAGRRSVVSHLAKLTRGEVARHLLVRPGAEPRTPQRLAAAVGEVFEVELTPPARDGARTLDVIIRN